MKTKIVNKQLSGVNKLADIVESTLGPRSSFVGIARFTPTGEIYDRVILKDGVSVARAIDFKDEDENFAAKVILESASKTVDETGDGTTVTVCLARAIINEAEKRIATGIHPMAIAQEIEPDIKKAVELLNDLAVPVKTLEEKIQVATVSCEEESLGKLIGETIDKVGEEGVVTIDKSKTGETYVEFQEGMQWDKGLASPYFVTDPDSLTGTIDDGYVLVTDYELTNILELKPFLDDFITHSRFLTIIAPDFSGDALSSLIANKLQNVFLTLCIKAPSFGGQQTNMLSDIATLTGAQFITKQQGHKLQDVRFSHLGKAQKITASQTTTILSGGEGNKDQIKERVEELKKLIKEEHSDFELERLRERLAKMTNGVAVIRVGGATDIEIKERFERALDATLATRQAVKKGIVEGGEVVYLNLIAEMKSPIIRVALTAPFRRLMTNAGYDGGQILERLLTAPERSGFDVTDGTIKDMFEAGIIDPVACSTSALINASSVALKLISTLNLVVPEEREEIKK